jgi:hypothetical protein
MQKEHIVFDLKRFFIVYVDKKPIFKTIFCPDYASYISHTQLQRSHRLGEHIWKRKLSQKVCAPKGTLFSKKTRFFTMFQKYVPDVITSYMRHIFFLEQIHIHMVFSCYKYGSGANKCGARTFIFVKKVTFFS